MNFNFHQSQFLLILTGVSVAIVVSGCSNITTTDYEATAKTTYVWQVAYSNNPNVGDKQSRFEEFGSTSLVNRNGLKPAGAVIGPDEKELWWSAIPPRPTLDEIEQRQQPYEKPGNPELLQKVDYSLTYRADGKTVTLPTNYDVYRQVVKAYPSRTPLTLTLGLNDSSVEKAEVSE